jgi:hypothetical protein
MAEAGLLTVMGSIRRMRCDPGLASCTFLWSVLLPTSRETAVTNGSVQGGGVRQVLPYGHVGRGVSAGARR